MNRVPDPLDANERALADLLARDALPGPSPQLDARILAAARAATTASPTTRSRRLRPRWIAGMGIAATLVLAVGIAWRLRPLPERPMASDAPTMESVVRIVEPAKPDAAPAADAAQPQVQARAVPVAAPMPPPPHERAPEPARKQAPPEPPVAFDEPAPMDTQAPPPAPPPPPARAVSPTPVAAAPAAATAQAPAMAPPADKLEAARAREDARTLDRVEVTGSVIPGSATQQAYRRDASGLDAAAAANAAAEDGVPRAVLDEEPPATADSPQVRDAWLQRIRELLSAGETEAARNSLAEFRRRYPKYALPEDLQRFTTP
jgi:outer membrane biosynthesis protein TonB